jgi:hypothetical protein
MILFVGDLRQYSASRFCVSPNLLNSSLNWLIPIIKTKIT